MSEFDLIRRHFTRPAPAGMLGVGDDCALLPAAPGAWAVSTDLLLEGRHFFPDVAPRALGHKALAVNLSDLAAMGATPRGCVLGVGLPRVNEAWIAEFAAGFHELAARSACPLVGGDTTRSDAGITISVTVFGAVDARRALRRDAARAGDDVWVSGTLGEADVALRLMLLARSSAVGEAVPDTVRRPPGDGAGRHAPGSVASPPSDTWSEAPATALPDGDALNAELAALSAQTSAALLSACRHRLEWPEPRLALGSALAGVAHAAIDVSDGLLQDLRHILVASDCAARLDALALPVSDALGGLPPALAWRAALGGGDAYELCFTAPIEARDAIEAIGRRTSVRVTRIGYLEAGTPDVVVTGEGGQRLQELPTGFDHFLPPGRPKAKSSPLGGSAARASGQAWGSFPPPGCPKAKSAPLGGSAARASGQARGPFPPPGRPKAKKAPVGGSAACASGQARGSSPPPDAELPAHRLS